MLSPSLYLFIMMYFSSFILVLSCNEWLMVWMGLEINMISFIMIMFNKYNINNIESCLKYFFVQSLGSVFLFMLLYLNYQNFYYISMVLIYKIGGGVFYFWFPSVCMSMNWMSCYMLMTFQKIIPMMLLSQFLSKMVWWMSLLSLMIGVLGSMNQINLKRLMAYSSIHHIGWMLISLMVNENLWILYLLIYSLMMVNFFNYMSKKMIENLYQVVKMNDKLMVMISLFNLGGIPPLLGFFLKWWFFYLVVMESYIMMVLLIFFSVVMLYIYIRLIYDFLLGGDYYLSWKIKIYKLNYLLNLDINILFSILLGILMGLFLIL